MNHVFVWNDGEVKYLDPVKGYEGCNVFGVSANGRVIVGISGDSFNSIATSWTDGGNAVAFSDTMTQGMAASADGKVIVGIAYGEQCRANRWTSEDGTEDLGSLNNDNALARGVSNDGTVVAGVSNSSKGYEAFRWVKGEGMVGLGDFEGGEYKSSAWTGVSGNGKVIVGQGTTEDGSVACIWDAEHGMRSIKEVLIECGLGEKVKGWKLTSANGVNLDGRTIVGFGVNPKGGKEGWIATLP
ncbi:hypothetical protein JD969_04815 [Planctomycetota bacterium]|nr:hypothetical protein JD969_04815 [Planctomycetota bacterium]